MKTPMVFGIGMNKTGGSSLKTALRRLGYTVKQAARTIRRVRDENVANDRLPLHGLTDQYDAFVDSPINALFKELDEAYPGSKFIYTHRDPRSWIISRMAQFGGTPKEHIAAHNKHLQAVKAHFADRPGDILWYQLCEGAGWAPLCTFLDVPIRHDAFPHSNITGPKRKRRFESIYSDYLRRYANE